MPHATPYDERTEIIQRREYKVVKANEIIQKAKYDLSVFELKILAFIFSMVKPTDTKDTEYTFSVSDFCKIAGIDSQQGKNYAKIKSYLKGLRDKSFWLTDEDGRETTIGWLSKATVSRGSGTLSIKLDEDLSKYIINLIGTPYTQYELISCLPMKSSYSIRLYELLKSYAFRKQVTFDIDELKESLAAIHYQNFKDFRVKCLEPGVRETNLYTDLEITWIPITKGKKVIQVQFIITTKDVFNRKIAHDTAAGALDNKKQIKGQMSLECLR